MTHSRGNSCEECRTLNDVMAVTQDKSLITDCRVLIRRHPHHTARPASVVEALRAMQKGASRGQHRSV
jgi:hypothetical protein